MMPLLSLPLEDPFESIDDVIQSLTNLEQIFHEKRDRRGVFATAYLTITREVQGRIQQGTFRDNNWVTSYLVNFANLYRKALKAYESRERKGVPKAWWISFETSVHNRGLAMQDLLLGVNAHVNYDLPFALLSAGIDPEQDKRYWDHTAVNEALKWATDDLQRRVAEMYAPILDVLDESVGELDERITHFRLGKAREACWVNALNLANAETTVQRQAIQADINNRAAVLARLMLYPAFPFPGLWPVLKVVERVRPWWRFVKRDA